MNFEMVKKELSGSKTVSVLISLFIIVASILVVISSILITTLISSNDSLSEKAYTPDVFIMSASKPDLEQIESFSTTNDNVKDFQMLEFLNIEGANININNNDSLTNSTQDNGFVTQSKTMDFLLDLDGNIAFPDEGEVFAPVIYLRENKIAIDDIIFIDGVPFTVVGFIRDSIMNANLVSSKRFLVHETDYMKIREHGSLEYLIEFNLNDSDTFSTFETDYLDYGLEINGQIISRSMIQLMNVLADSMMMVILILVSMLIIFITFICIKFILNAKVVDDYREIGVLKAIGLSVSDIKKIYSKQYFFLVGVSCTIGLIIAILTKDIFLKDIILFMGKPNNYNIAFIIGLLAVLLIFIIIMLYINKTLNQFKKISPVEAINMSIIPEKTKKSKLFSLKNSKLSNINILIGLKDIVSNKKRYLSIALMMVLLTFVMIVPQNIHTTINSPSFMGYMGIGKYDIRFDIQQVDEIEEKVLLISSQLENDSNISNYSVSYSKIFRALDSNDEVEMIKIELGNHTIFPIPYTSGKFPEGEKEIALSSSLSSDFNKQVGDSIVILIDEIPTEFVITGIYSDLTNGGRTAKATFLHTSADILWSTIGASVENQELLPEIVETYSDTYSFAKITSVEEYGSQLFASMLSAVVKSVYLSIVIVFLIIFLIISLFLNLIIKKEKNEIANMKAMGFTQKDFDIQYITKIILPAFIGVLFGVLFSNTVGEKLSGLLLAFLGVSGFRFAVNVFLVYFIYPFILLLTVVIAIMFTLRSIHKIDISSYIMD